VRVSTPIALVLLLALSHVHALALAQQEIIPPRQLNRVEPRYPDDAKKRGIEGAVLLKLTIDSDGAVSNVELLDSLSPSTDAAAVEAARRLRFSPARRADGSPFAAKIRYRFRFRMTPAPPKPKPAPALEQPPEAKHEKSAEQQPQQPTAIDIVVEGERPPRGVTHHSVEQREMDRIPGTGGDALKSIQSLPGVARTPGVLGGLLVRGSAPFDSQTFVDGVYVPLIYHFGGLSSVVPTELLSKIDFYPGNYSARYGRALGGIVDAGIRSPRSDGYHGLAQIDFIDARLMVEGPIPLLEGWSFAAAGRRSHLDAWLGPVLEETGAGVTQAPRYYDYQFMIEGELAGDDRVRISLYGSDDGLEILLREPPPGEPALSGNLGLSTAFQRLQVGYQVGDEDDRVETQLALGHELIRVGIGTLFIDLEGYTVFGRTEHSHRLGRRATMHTGVDWLASWVDVSQRLPAAEAPGQPAGQPFTTEQLATVSQRIPVFQPALYSELELTPHARWRVVPGLRIDYTRATDQFDPNPRINSRFDVMQGSRRTTLKGGVGIFTQPPQPQESNPPLGTQGIGANRAIQYGLGVEQEITRQLEVSLEGFYKQLDDMVVARANDTGVAAEFSNEGRGRVFGAELLIKYKADERFFGWLAYTLSRATQQNDAGADESLLPWDQTHNLTVLGSYRLGHGWEIGARFRLVSGNPTDLVVCDSAVDSCDAQRINALFHAASGAYTPVRFGANNSERLPTFHQLDVRIDKSWRFSSWKLSMYLDIQNVYNQQNVEGIAYDYRFRSRQFVTGVPILPSLGLRGEL